MKSNLETALALLADDLPIPVDLQTALTDEGIDVSALEDSDAADTQLTVFTYTADE